MKTRIDWASVGGVVAILAAIFMLGRGLTRLINNPSEEACRNYEQSLASIEACRRETSCRLTREDLEIELIDKDQLARVCKVRAP